MGRDGRAGSVGAQTSIPGLRRALGAAGVPVEVASDDVPLVRDPAVLPMLDALRARCSTSTTRTASDVDYVDPGRAEALLIGPLGGLDAGDVRRLGTRAAVPGEGADPPIGDPGTARPASSSVPPSWSRGSSRECPARPPIAPEPSTRCWSGRVREPRRRRHRRAGALDAVVGHLVARAAAARGRVRAAGRAPGQPRPRLRGGPLRRGGPRGGAARPPRRAQLPGHPRRPADPGRHPRPSAASAGPPSGC